jgi:pimeloyl-ACP methyl ester carboxylesterase
MNVGSMEEELTFTLPDGRKLGYLIVGEGKPVFYFHGQPGSRFDILHLNDYVNSRNLKIIGIDRPGFGLSTYTPRLSLRDFCEDVNHLADHLGIDKFTLIGYSAGGPCAITYVALFPERVTQAVIISSQSLPMDIDELFSGLERIIVKLASRFQSIATWYLKQERDRWFEFAKDPESFLESKRGKSILDNMSENGARLIMDDGFRAKFLHSVIESYRQEEDSVRSLYEERLLMNKGWDVDISLIPSGLVYILHGADDKRIPVINAHRNSEDIPGAQLEIVVGKGHFFWFDNLEKLDEILS